MIVVLILFVFYLLIICLSSCIVCCMLLIIVVRLLWKEGKWLLCLSRWIMFICFLFWWMSLRYGSVSFLVKMLVVLSVKLLGFLLLVLFWCVCSVWK